MSLPSTELFEFIKESNKIERILRFPSQDEITAYQGLLALDKITIEDMREFVRLIQPGAVLRDQAGLNVRVGNHIPPFGGPAIRVRLEELLAAAQQGSEAMAFDYHKIYETLHPFTDGNGRSGRALWLWMMNGRAPLGFLHKWYYQSLDDAR